VTFDYPCTRVTEAGPTWWPLEGTRDRTLLAEGIGDTLRYSLTADRWKRQGRSTTARVLGCANERTGPDRLPSCGRAEVDVIKVPPRPSPRCRRWTSDPSGRHGLRVNGPGELATRIWHRRGQAPRHSSSAQIIRWCLRMRWSRHWWRGPEDCQGGIEARLAARRVGRSRSGRDRAALLDAKVWTLTMRPRSSNAFVVDPSTSSNFRVNSLGSVHVEEENCGRPSVLTPRTKISQVVPGRRRQSRDGDMVRCAARW